MMRTPSKVSKVLSVTVHSLLHRSFLAFSSQLTTYFYFAGGPDLVDIYNSNLNGGFNTTYGGEAATGAPIGHEVNVRLGYDASPSKSRRVRFNIEAGTFIPGDDLKGVIDDPIHVLQLTTHIQL